jgi:hypothetical protein
VPSVSGVLSVLCVLGVPAWASPSGVVITGFQVRGPAGGNDEYVEIRNLGASNVNISGWRLQGCASASPGTASEPSDDRQRVTRTRTVLPFTNNAAGGYSGSVTGDQSYGTGFTDFSASNFAGIQLLDVSNAKQDGVGSP